MVFGFGEGKVDIKLERNNFKKGEAVKGKVVLELGKPKKAKELRVELVAEREAYVLERGKRRRRKETVYSYPLRLGGEKEYASGSYDFEIAIPDLAQAEKPGGMLGEVVKVAAMFGGPSAPRWYLKASLDVPMSMDITKEVQINVV